MLLSPNILNLTASDLRSRITIRHGFPSFDADHNIVIKYNDNYNVDRWACVSAKTSVLNFQQNADDNKIVYEVIVRYGASISMDDDIIFNGSHLKLSAPPTDIEGRHKFLAMECYEQRSANTGLVQSGTADIRGEVSAVQSGNADTERGVTMDG